MSDAENGIQKAENIIEDVRSYIFEQKDINEYRDRVKQDFSVLGFNGSVNYVSTIRTHLSQLENTYRDDRHLVKLSKTEQFDVFEKIKEVREIAHIFKKVYEQFNRATKMQQDYKNAWQDLVTAFESLDEAREINNLDDMEEMEDMILNQMKIETYEEYFASEKAKYERFEEAYSAEEMISVSNPKRVEGIKNITEEYRSRSREEILNSEIFEEVWTKIVQLVDETATTMAFKVYNRMTEDLIKEDFKDHLDDYETEITTDLNYLAKKEKDEYKELLSTRIPGFEEAYSADFPIVTKNCKMVGEFLAKI